MILIGWSTCYSKWRDAVSKWGFNKYKFAFAKKLDKIYLPKCQNKYLVFSREMYCFVEDSCMVNKEQSWVLFII